MVTLTGDRVIVNIFSLLRYSYLGRSVHNDKRDHLGGMVIYLLLACNFMQFINGQINNLGSLSKV